MSLVEDNEHVTFVAYPFMLQTSLACLITHSSTFSLGLDTAWSEPSHAARADRDAINRTPVFLSTPLPYPPSARLSPSTSCGPLSDHASPFRLLFSFSSWCEQPNN